MFTRLSLLKPSCSRCFSKALTLKLENPYTFDIITEIPYINLEEADKRLYRSQEFFKTWKYSTQHDRKQAIRSLLHYLDKVTLIQNQDLIAKEITMQMGKPIKQSYQEIQDVIQYSNILLDLSDKALESEIIEISKGSYKTIEKIPLGPVYIIGSLDFPLTYVAAALVPAILAGNTVIIKPSPYTPLSTQHFEKAFEEVGLSDLVLSTLIPVGSIGQFFSNSNLGYVNYFGNVLSGKEVYEHVSKSSCITDVGLFLGCNNGAYVADDANIEHAAKDLIDSCMFNSGQSTYKIDRILVHSDVYHDFIETAEHYVKQFKIGDPMQYTTKIGPIAVPENLENIKTQIDEALQTNADLRVGGNITNDEEGKGRFFEPTLISDLDDSMRIFQEETYGPIASVSPVLNEEEAIRRINNSDFSIQCGIYTEDKDRAMKFTRSLDAGIVWANQVYKLDPSLPWTGWRNSGKNILFSRHCFRHFYRLQTSSLIFS